MIELREHQLDAVERLGHGKVLWGGVGSGKTLTVLEYYMRNEAPRHIYVITTPKKRDSLDWEKEAAKFGISTAGELSIVGTLVVDSWYNVGKYLEVEDAFFIFDEQRVVGTGSWVKSFLTIAENNRWVLLSATPGDTWSDYAPVFIANGYFKNISDFRMKHVVYEPFSRYPKVRFYLSERKLERMRNNVLVEMPWTSDNRRVPNWMEMSYDVDLFHQVWKKRWHVYEDRPIKDVAELFRVMRRVVNSDPSRLDFIWDLLRKGVHDKIVVFYNFDYELEILRSLAGDVVVAEWNGHKKEPIPAEGPWVYLVQYTSGAEGWNCTSTNATVFYSLNYSWKTTEQSQGRTDRMDTPFKTLYYYFLVTNSVPDLAIKRSLQKKEAFNERKFMDEIVNEMT